MGVVNPEFDQKFLDNLSRDPLANTRISHTEFMREAGCEAWR